MKIYLKELRDEEVLSLEENLDPNRMELNIGIMRFPKPLRISANAWRTGNELVVQAHISGECHFACSRCLEEFNKLFEKDATLYYDIEDLDSVTVDEEVRDEILLDHPIRVFCREDCRGLCPSCGSNLNNTECRCQKEKN